MLTMTPKRALWEALATVCVPSVVIWGTLLHFARAQPDEWPIYLILFALPLPLIFPIYNRYRTGAKYGGNRTPRHHLTWAILSAVFSAVCTGIAFHRTSADRTFYLIIAMTYVAGSVDHLRRWAKTRTSTPPDGIKA
jgi:hypothetical protein